MSLEGAASLDILSDVLRVVRLTGSVFFVGEFSAPWVIDEPGADFLTHSAIPNAECIVLFHILIEGDCYVCPKGLPAVHMQAGDVIILPHGDSHKMSSHADPRPTLVKPAMARNSASDVGQITLAGRGAKSRFICGYLNCDQRFNPLVGALPNIMVVRAADNYTLVEAVDRKGKRPARVSQGSGTWLSTTLKFAIHEAKTGHPGNGAMLGRLTELMFVEILRQYMQQLPPDQAGWLAGLNDPQVGKALRPMHAQPERNWTVEELAREAGVSRSVLAARFTELLGESPIRYLARWRVHLAKQLLRESAFGIAEIAARVGYDSEAAFNRAFKRAEGQPPATWRRKLAAPPRMAAQAAQ